MRFLSKLNSPPFLIIFLQRNRFNSNVNLNKLNIDLLKNKRHKYYTSMQHVANILQKKIQKNKHQ